MPAFIKDEWKKKDEQKLEDMKKEIEEAVHGDRAEDFEDPLEDSAGVSPYAAADAGADLDGEESSESPEPGSPEALQKEVEQLQDTLKAKEDGLLRLQADFENFRRRTAKEKEELGAVVTQEFLKDMLPLLDNFERAMAAEGKDLDTFQKGVRMIATQFGEILKKHGLEPIETAGQKFDPNFHQAVMRVQNPELEDEAIAQELQRGYMAKGRVIRPSMVQVVSNG